MAFFTWVLEIKSLCLYSKYFAEWILVVCFVLLVCPLFYPKTGPHSALAFLEPLHGPACSQTCSILSPWPPEFWGYGYEPPYLMVLVVFVAFHEETPGGRVHLAPLVFPVFFLELLQGVCIPLYRRICYLLMQR